MTFSIVFSVNLIIAMTVYANAKHLQNSVNRSQLEMSEDSRFAKINIRPYQQQINYVIPSVAKFPKGSSTSLSFPKQRSPNGIAEKNRFNTNKSGNNGTELRLITTKSVIRAPLHRSDCSNGQIRNNKGQCVNVFEEYV